MRAAAGPGPAGPGLAGRLLRTWARLAGGRGGHGGRRAVPEDDEGGFRGESRRRVGGATPAPAAAAGGGAGGDAGAGGGERPPGAQGLRNHGNTCFMNAVVQCLSNTAPLAERLALGRYRARGARGEVTHRLAALVRALWTRDYTPQLSAEFKNIVSKHSSQFRGNAQHDALEFLLWLLDRMHEDLGAASPAQQSRGPAQPGKDGSSGASRSPPGTQHPRGQSFVQSHFQAQYRSSLTCPHCLKQSNTFDPFLCISLPIPLRQTRALNVTLVLQCERWRFVRVGLAVPLLGTVADLREMVAREGRIPPEQVILAEVSPRGFLRSLSDPEALGAAGEAGPVYAFQPPPARRAGCPRSLPTSPSVPRPEGPRLLPSTARSSDCLHRAPGGRILLLLCNTAGTGPQLARFGPPLVLREERGVSWEQLQQSILAQMRGVLRGEVRPQGTGALFRIRLAGGAAPCTYLSPQDPRPLCHPAIDRALQLSGPGGPPHVKLTVEWDMSTKERLFGSLQEEVVQDAESVWRQQQAHGQQHSCTLDECFQLYTKEEQLAPDDAWRCPHCKVPQQGTVKLSLWTLPDILIIHLKRFRQVAEQRHKLTTLVRFPLRGLDMAPHVAQRGQPGGQLLGRWAPWQPPLRLPPGCPRDHLYDLYAVCNHHGSMQGGHYTAFCCNALDGRWYSYDDSRVEGVREAEVSTRSAYILFYQRRHAAGPGTGSAAAAGHWLFRLAASEPRADPRSDPDPSGSAAAPENGEAQDARPPVPPAPPARPDRASPAGGFEARPAVRGLQGLQGLQGRSLSVRTAPAGPPGQGEPGPPRAPRRLRRAASAEGTPRRPPPGPGSPGAAVPHGDAGVPPGRCPPGPSALGRSRSSASLPPRPEGGLRRSASLGRAAGVPPLAARGPPGATLQRGRQPPGPLRPPAVPESSF
ncbi:ubiquitin carboxyl-terminal hydrolase 43 [Corvus hawaiiensis]|uniref:ubiquitin carboxyl-terminal hydrolase 43 n=1 Tax=Corvus hawaiiensis TaxID=134902 RepID=UPI002019A9A4|nr:ubiquitin carboxyl-terminal hydrolase 43 [Corvus hawaiiensis]